MDDFKILKGDCLKELPKLIDDGVKVDLVLTDPPYNIDLTPPRKTSKFYNTKVINDDNFDWLDEFVELVDEISTNIVAVFCGWSTLKDVQTAFEKRFKLKNVLVWDKMWFGMGQNYRPNFELICLFCKTNFTTPSNNKSNILSYRRIAPTKLLHSCQKPVELLEDLIVELSQENDLVLDCFMGSGSTGVACAGTGRRFIGVEMDDNYFNIAEKRIQEAYDGGD